MNYINSIFDYNGKKYYLTWMNDVDFANLSPITQVYAVVFNENGEILVCRHDSESKWQIPGGTPESNESTEETLHRELIEEVDATVSKFMPLGVQKVEEEVNGEKFLSSYQIRYVCLLDKLLEQTPDPDPKKGYIWERKFVPQAEINSYVNWGEIGKAMFSEATQIYNNQLKNN